MSGPIAAQSKPAATQAGTVTQHASIAPPDDYVPLTAEGILIFCQSRLREFDDAIAKKMDGQKSLLALQSSVSDIQSDLKRLNKSGADGDEAFKDQGTVDTLTVKLDSAINSAKASGNNDLAASLQSVREKLRAGDGPTGDGKVLIGEIKDMNSILDNALSTTRSGAEVSMIELQSLISKRATTLQLTTGMMNSIDEAPKAIAGNIGR